MDPIRSATIEEIKTIEDEADLTGQSGVLRFGNDMAVIRSCTEIDPVFFDSESSYSRKLMFIWGIENILRANGLTEYYFNISPEDKAWKQTVEKYGAKPQSLQPEIRYKKLLVPTDVKKENN